MRICVTGGAGFIGSHTTDALVEQGHQVLVVDDLSSGSKNNLNAQAEFEEISILDPKLENLFSNFRPEAVVHLAAQMDVRKSVQDPAFDARVNVVGTATVAQRAVAAGCKRVVFASSGGAIYGDTTVTPTPESHEKEATSPYGLSKWCGEQYLDYFRRASGLEPVCMRYGNVYGPRQDPHGEAGVVAIFCERLLNGQALSIFGDGEQTRDYVHVADIVRANLLAIETSNPGAYNIGTGEERSVLFLAEELLAASGKDIPVEHHPARPGEQQRVCLNVQHVADKLGWSPEFRIRDGLRDTYKWFAKRPPECQTTS